MKKALAAGTSDDGAALASPSRGPRPTTRDARANHATDSSTQTSPMKFTIEFSGVGGAGAAASALGALAASQPKSSSQTLCQPVESVANASKRMCRAGCDGAYELSDRTRHAKVKGKQYCVTACGDFDEWLRDTFPDESPEFVISQVNKRQKLTE